MSKLRRMIGALFCGLLLTGASSFATEVSYRVTDLPDVQVNQDLWQIDYHLSASLAPLEGVEIEFAAASFSQVSLLGSIDSLAFTALVNQPIAVIDAPGLLQLTAQRSIDAERFDFSVSVISLAGAPGAQRYKVFDQDFNAIPPDLRLTLAVPEPGSAWLMLAALAIAPVLRLRRRAA